MFNRKGDRLFFLRDEWPDGPTGVPKASLWEVAIDGTAAPKELADHGLFDSPLTWRPKEENPSHTVTTSTDGPCNRY